MRAGFLAAVCAILLCSSQTESATNMTAVLCKTPAGVIRRGETAEMVLQPSFSSKDLSWRLLNWRGNEVRRGVWPAEGPLRLESLPVGAYTLAPTRADGTTLHDTIVTVVEPLGKPLPRDSYFAIMTALSCCTIPDAAANRRFRGDYPWFGGDGTLLHAELLKTLGIPNVREILLWSREQTVSNAPAQIEKAREEPAWRYLAERGIGVDFFNQSTPVWAVGTTKRAKRNDGVLRDVTRNLTRDYKRLYDYYKWAAETFAGQAISFEHWNEPDICGDEPAWDYAASMKAAYLGVKAGNANVPVLQGSFCQTPFTGYNRLVMANDIARYSDIFNYHTYADLRNIPSFMAGLRQNLAEAGIPNRAIWLTEMNTNQEGDADLPSVRAGNWAHSPDQQRLLVEYVAKGEILHMMEGVARTFYFILPGINEREGRKDWGLSRRDGCMKPAYAALANLIRRVGHARLLGEMGLGKGVRGFLFDQDDGTQTLVVWAPSELDTGGQVSNRSLFARTVELRTPGMGAVTVYDACGTPRTEKVENGVLQLKVDRYATYVTGLRGLKAARPPRPTGAVGALPTPATMDPTLVVRIDLDERDFMIGGNKTIAEMNVPEGRATLVVWNLSETEKTGSLSVEGAGATGLPAAVTVAAWGKVEMPIRLQTGADGFKDVSIRGMFGGKTISPLKMRLRNQAALEAGARVVTPDLSDLASWQKNDNARTRSFAWDEQEKAFRFDVVWEPSERNPWAFERLLIDPNRARGIFAVEYEAKMVQDKIENDTRQSVFYVCNGPKFKPSSYRVEPPRDGWERRRVNILPEHAADVTGLQFGCCPCGRKLSFWVRNVRLLCADLATAESSVAAPPMLAPDVTVPNGGTLRFFPFGDFTRGNVPEYAKVFEESPYQTLSALRYDRPNWFELESAEGAYLFDTRVEPMLVACVKNRQRLFLGLACNAGSMSVTQLHEGRALAVPLAVFERCAAEGHPFRPCDQYGPAWVPDYDSQYLLERHRSLLKAFAAWLEGKVRGTDVRRRDVLYGIEMRYAGYWGEGAMRREHYPKTDLFDRYAEAYVEAFPDTLLCAGGHEFNALPRRASFDRNPTDAQWVRAMAHVGKILKLRNAVGPLGFFIDSWQSPSDLYDRDGTRVYTDEAGRVASLADTLFGEIYRKRYVTGEFGYLTWLSDPKLAPYEKLVEQVETRGVSGLSVHNFTVKDLASLKGVKRERGAHYLPGGLPIDRATYARGSRALGLIGYRFVLTDPCVERTAEGVRASFALANIGASRLFHGYNALHLQARDATGRLIEDRRLAYDLRRLDPKGRQSFVEDFSSEVTAVALVIPDETGIECPLTLSNRGRRADGSYVLGILH